MRTNLVCNRNGRIGNLLCLPFVFVLAPGKDIQGFLTSHINWPAFHRRLGETFNADSIFLKHIITSDVLTLKNALPVQG